jgi:hypothetical protein
VTQLTKISPLTIIAKNVVAARLVARVVSAGVGKCHMPLVRPVDMVFLLILVGGGHFYQFARADGLICQNFARF